MKTLLPLLAVLVLTGCIRVTKSTMQSSRLDDNKTLIRRWISVADAQDFDSFSEFLDDDLVMHFPGGGDLNRSEVEQAERGFAMAFPDAQRTIEELIADGDKVVLRETFYGTHNGEFQGIPPTGRQVQLGAMVIYRINNGKIIESWVEADFAGLMNQLTESHVPNYSAEQLEINKQAVRYIFEVIWNNEVFNDLDKVLAPEVIFHHRGMHTMRHEDLRSEVERWHTAFPDFKFVVEDLVAQDDRVAIRVKYTGTHSGSDWWDMPASGKSMDVTEMMFFRLQNGKVVEAWEIFDQYIMRQQLGF